MSPDFFPDGRAMLIGSQPLDCHDEAFQLVLACVPEIPNWVQLPVFAKEGMLAQFADGLPGLVRHGDRLYVDASADGFDDALTAFYEEYLGVVESDHSWDNSRFALTPDMTQGFFTMLETLAKVPGNRFAVKGQVTGPITFTTAIKDQDRRAIFYHEGLRDAAVKLIALKAGWQVRQLRLFGVPVIVFIDEPALAGYGSSEFISISREHMAVCLQEVIDAIHDQGGLAGVHVCANTDWSLLLDSTVDIVNFDAHGYFDKLILYGQQIRNFLDSGRYLAWGAVPTSQAQDIEAATVEGLYRIWCGQCEAIQSLGVDPDALRRQSFITPSCGTGSLSRELSTKVLELTRALSQRIRQSR